MSCSIMIVCWFNVLLCALVAILQNRKLRVLCKCLLSRVWYIAPGAWSGHDRGIIGAWSGHDRGIIGAWPGHYRGIIGAWSGHDQFQLIHVHDSAYGRQSTVWAGCGKKKMHQLLPVINWYETVRSYELRRSLMYKSLNSLHEKQRSLCMLWMNMYIE